MKHFLTSMMVLLVLSAAATSVLADVNGYQYAAKYICGTPGENKPLSTRHYLTAINVVNSNDKSTTVSAKIVPTNENGSTGLYPKKIFRSYTGLELDCPIIREVLSESREPVTGFVKGMVLVQSCDNPIDVIAVYTAHQGGNGEDSDLSLPSPEVEQINGRQVMLSNEVCAKPGPPDDPGPPNKLPECTPKDTPGCDGCEGEACVCELDQYCCTYEWDARCVDHLQKECGYDSCNICTPSCGPTQQCGDDGCGGSCGTCPGGNESCLSGVCVD